MVGVLLVDDQPLLRLGFRSVLNPEPDLEVLGEAGGGAEAVTMTRALRPDVVLMDVRMPGMDGIEATRRIIADGSPAKVVVLTTFDLDEYVYDALRAGASCQKNNPSLLKDAAPAELLHGIRVVAAGESALAPAVTRRLIARFAEQVPVPERPDPLAALPDPLTGREHEVLRALAKGLSNREIGARLHLSELTIKVHVGRILTKLGLRDRAQVIVFAYEHGIVRPGRE
ncbi:response regulator [Crossiella cryophila]|uniref:DNA-binding NarL/FixJ family response regulator n=1 Tax=Crossiella cryophila TaxID=43355 RepID=A0A7W7FT51_9PSEU|nr:response regulator transcription factor [Crossiella cryophila]MBB4677766.1 DNA-binding NarL/FixJ family response regulator [Crossiella cryophila]